MLVFCAHFVLALFEMNRKVEEKHSKLDFSEMAVLTFVANTLQSFLYFFFFFQRCICFKFYENICCIS